MRATFIPSMKHTRSENVGNHTIFQIGRAIDRRWLIAEHAVHRQDSPCYMGASFYSLCPHCGSQDTCYTIVSYDTIIFQDCAHCEYVSFDARYYSKTTSTLQQAIAHAYNLTEQWNANAQERKESKRIIYQQKRQR